MQQALPYKAWQPAATRLPPPPPSLGGRESVRSVVLENAVIVVATRGCCMGHVVRQLLLTLGVNPVFYEVEIEEEESVASELREVVESGGGGDGKLQFPAVFIGGRLFGGLDRIMAAHITGELTPVLKQAGALWLLCDGELLLELCLAAATNAIQNR